MQTVNLQSEFICDFIILKSTHNINYSIVQYADCTKMRLKHIQCLILSFLFIPVDSVGIGVNYLITVIVNCINHHVHEWLVVIFSNVTFINCYVVIPSLSQISFVFLYRIIDSDFHDHAVETKIQIRGDNTFFETLSLML